MEVQVKNNQGGDAGTLEIADSVWAVKMNQPVLHQVIVAQQANKRQGGADTKNRSDIIASNRKLRAQKGGGRARLGPRSSPAQVGGAVAHGPHPKSYRLRVPVKMRRLALKIALSEQLRQGKVTFMDRLSVDEPSTSALAKSLESVRVDQRSLVITSGDNSTLVMSARNLDGITILSADLVNPLDIYSARQLIITQAAAKRIDEIWATTGKSSTAAGAGA
jgi:large subunit ribosomal protein L4